MSAAAVGRLLVVGAGLIGTSVALAARRGWPGVHITGVDVPSVALAARRGWPGVHITGVDVPAAIAQCAPGVFDDVRESTAAVPDFDLAVLACPVDAMADWMARLADAAPDGVVTDVGGVKRAPRDAAARAGLTHFVGGHPMAGAARPGPALASATLFAGRPWFVVAGEAPQTAVDTTRALVNACGARIVEVTADDHDGIVAAVSHLPQVVASVLMTAVDAAAGAHLDCAGGGLRDTTRVAASPATTWLPVLAANADQIAPLLEAVAARLRDAATALGDRSAMQALFEDANRARARLSS